MKSALAAQQLDGERFTMAKDNQTRVPQDGMPTAAPADALHGFADAFAQLVRTNMAQASDVIAHGVLPHDFLARASQASSEHMAQQWDSLVDQWREIAADAAQSSRRRSDRMEQFASSLTQSRLPTDLWELQRQLLQAELTEASAQYTAMAKMVSRMMRGTLQAAAGSGAESSGGK